MAKVEFSGIDQLELSFAEVAKLPDEVVDAMLDARADVVVAAQRQAAERMLKGPYDTGETARSIKKGKPKLRDGQRVLYVTPTGSRKRGKAKAVRMSTMDAICRELQCQPGDLFEFVEDDDPWKR